MCLHYVFRDEIKSGKLIFLKRNIKKPTECSVGKDILWGGLFEVGENERIAFRIADTVE